MRKKNKMSRNLIIGLAIALTTIVLILGLGTPVAKASQARAMLEESISGLEPPPQDEIFHFRYTIYQRVPPSELEPDDPYHLPYKEMWPEVQTVDHWGKLDDQGGYTWWRTQLRNSDGTLVQDLMYQDGTETDFFPLLGSADTFEQPAMRYFDERANAIQDFLNSDLSREERETPTGEPVLSVFSEQTSVEGSSWGSGNIEEALLCWRFCPTFVADLHPVTQARRIDFSITDQEPIGEGRVVWDQSGDEYLVWYRTYSDPDLITEEEAIDQDLFIQTIPSNAFQTEWTLAATEAYTTLPEILEAVEFGLFVFPESSDYKLISIEYLIPEDPNAVPPAFRDVSKASSLGAAVTAVYSISDATISITQGPAAEFSALLRNTSPEWTRAESRSIELAGNLYSAWLLYSQTPEDSRIIIEAGPTLLYVIGTGLSLDELYETLKGMTHAK